MPARDRNEFELDAFAGEEALLLGDGQIERRYAPYGRRDLPVTEVTVSAAEGWIAMHSHAAMITWRMMLLAVALTIFPCPERS